MTAASRARGGLVEAHKRRTTGLFMGAAFIAALGLAAAVLVVSGTDAESIRRALRLTARFSFLLFWCAYAGGSLAAPFGFRTIARHGRDFGLAFASGHTIHLLLVVWLYQMSSTPPLSDKDAVFFGVGIMWTYLLTLLSVQCLSKMLAPKVWCIVRLIGMEYIMLAFQYDFLPTSFHANTKHLLLYAPFAALGMTGTALRIVSWVRKIQRNPDSSYGIFLLGRLLHCLDIS